MRKLKLSTVPIWELAAILVGAVLVLIAGFWAAAQFIRPAPPDKLTITTGADGGAYYFFAEHYKKILARDDITLEILISAGSLENLARLTSPEAQADLGFVQSGVSTSEDSPGLVSLGSVAYEPLWVFYRTGKTTPALRTTPPSAKEGKLPTPAPRATPPREGGEAPKITRLSQLLGKKLAIGTEGSGTRKLALELLALNSADENPNHRIALGGWDAARALNLGEVDAAFFVASFESPMIQQLLELENISLMSFELAESYTRKIRSLYKLTLPQGVVDFTKNIPPANTTLIAPASTLIAREDLHPALMYLILEAAAEVHGKPGVFSEKGEFPAPKDSNFPLSDEAQRFYKSGTPFLQRYLPFWIANFITRMAVLLVPIVTLLIPLFKVVPLIYSWRIRSRLYRWYGELRFLEDDVVNSSDTARHEEFEERLDRIEDAVNHLPTPPAYADRHYILKQHVDFVREKIGRRVAP
ncbi:MAG: TAXI family TRAP transporter solute-binding subunit [Burkholderiales bacterium]